jgi:hypothetical protein
MEGEPYDEGYFIEYDQDISPEQSMRREVVYATPEFDPTKAPVLDPIAWPAARVLKARRNYSKGYVRETVDSLLDLYGEKITNFIVQEAARCLAVQYAHELRADTGIEGRDVQAAAKFLGRILQACDQTFEIRKNSAKEYEIILETFKPFDDVPSDAIRASFFQFQEMAVRLINGHLKIERCRESRAGAPHAEIWTITDTGRWRW